MTSSDARYALSPRAAPTGHPVRSAFAQFPVVCFTLALLTDLAYRATVDLMWSKFSAWLLLAGLVGGGLAALAVLVALIAHRRDPWLRPSWAYVVGGLVVLLLAVLNSFVHARDGWTAVVPLGLTLSALTFAAILATAILDRLALGQRLGRARP